MKLLDRKITDEIYDIVVLGGGVAGLAAAMTAGQHGLRVLALEKTVFGGSVAVLETVSGYPGIENIGGWELTQTMVEQAEKVGCILLDSIEATDVRKSEDKDFEVICRDGNRFRGRSVIVTTGGNPKLLGLEEESQFARRGIHICAQCAGGRYKDRDVIVAGNGSWAVEASLHLLNLECRVTFITGDPEMTGNARLRDILLGRKGFRFMPGHHVVKLHGDEYLEEIETVNLASGKYERMKAAAVFVYRGIEPDMRLAAVHQDEKGFFKVDENFMTSLPGVFATGRVVYADLPIQVLVGDGSRAALGAASWLETES